MTALVLAFPLAVNSPAKVAALEAQTKREAKPEGHRVRMVPLPVVTRNPDDPNGKGAA